MATNAEVLLISSVLREGSYVEARNAGAKPDLFSIFNAEWEWIAKYYNKHRKTPSKLAFTNKFPNFRVKAVNDTKHFVEEVQSANARRKMTGIMKDATDMLVQGEVNQAIALMQSEMNTVAADMGTLQEKNVLTDWQDTYKEVAARKKRREENGSAGVPTGFDTLDEVTGGMQPGWLVMVNARLGEGKSATLMNMATSAIMGGYSAHFSALEMTSVEVSMRLHNYLSGSIGKRVFQSHKLAQGLDVDMKEYREFLRDIPRLVKGKFTVSDDPRLDIMGMVSQIERHKPDIYFLDYITLMKTHGDGGWLDIAQLTKEIKATAKKYDIPVIAAAQLNRNAVGKDIAGADSIGESDEMGRSADAVINMKQMSASVIKMKLVKFRHGRAGYSWYTNFDMTRGKFEEISHQRALELIDQDRLEQGEDE